jgi:hypothetical protein
MSESLRDRSPYGLMRFTYFAPSPCFVSQFGNTRHHGWGGKSQKKIRRERRQREGKR